MTPPSLEGVWLQQLLQPAPKSQEADACSEQARRLSQDPAGDHSPGQDGHVTGHRCHRETHPYGVATTDEQPYRSQDREGDDTDGPLIAAAVLQGSVEAALDRGQIVTGNSPGSELDTLCSRPMQQGRPQVVDATEVGGFHNDDRVRIGCRPSCPGRDLTGRGYPDEPRCQVIGTLLSRPGLGKRQ